MKAIGKVKAMQSQSQGRDRQMKYDEGSWQSKGRQCKGRLEDFCKKGADSAETTSKQKGSKSQDGGNKWWRRDGNR
jgi:hypothetical protein